MFISKEIKISTKLYKINVPARLLINDVTLIVYDTLW